MKTPTMIDKQYEVEGYGHGLLGARYADEITVTIYVTNVDESPTFTAGATTVTHAEFTGTGDANP